MPVYRGENGVPCHLPQYHVSDFNGP